jgi:hypothetical protein
MANKRFTVKTLPSEGYGIFDKDKQDFVRNDGIAYSWRRKYVASNWLKLEIHQERLIELQNT